MTNKIFDYNHFIGYVCQIFPNSISIHIPSSNLLSLYHYDGEKYHPGIVGSYVIIEGEEYGFLGKILELNLSEKERIGFTESSFEKENHHPIGKVEVLIAFNYYKNTLITKGYNTLPHIGSKVYSCSTKFLEKYLNKFGIKNEKKDTLLELATLSSDINSKIKISSQSLFNRHCAVVGTTGGGKSWTVAKLIEEISKKRGKIILIDATGEYEPLMKDNTSTEDVIIGKKGFYFHYSNLTISDIFSLLKPSDRIQRPKLMEAIRSLKMVKINNEKNIEHSEGAIKYSVPVNEGLLEKKGAQKRAYQVFYYKHTNQIESIELDFDITKLSNQIRHECVLDSDKNHPEIFGTYFLDNDLSMCVSLISRINNLIATEDFSSIFGFKDKDPKDNNLIKQIEVFMSNPEKRLLRISLENTPYEYQIREILVNAIGRYLLRQARQKKFTDDGKQLIVFIDEAHQFLNKAIQDEYFSAQPLDAFDSIAKECRKYGLFLCLATQMPRDIPHGTLSQMGTFIVHRLINKYDKEAIENACSSANSSVLSFMPILGEGEALLVGVDFPMPLSIKFLPPFKKPNSNTPSVIFST